MVGWPQITEPLLRERQGMSNEEFLKSLAELLEAIGTRELDDEHYKRAIGFGTGSSACSSSCVHRPR
jgi:hypothetical protein